KDIETLVSDCEICQQHRSSPTIDPGVWPRAQTPWERLHMDFLDFNGEKIFVVIDTYSRWLEAILMKSTTASCVIKVLRQLFTTHGIPRFVVSDNGPPFQTTELAEFFKANGVRQKFSETYHPATNGSAER